MQKLFSFFYIIVAVVQIKAYGLNDTSIINHVYTAQELEDKYFDHIKFINTEFDDIVLDSVNMKNSSFLDCKLESREFVNFFTANNLYFLNTLIIELSFRVSEINDVSFHNCTIKRLDLLECITSNLQFHNCNIEELNITYGNINGLNIIGGKIKDITITKTTSNDVDISLAEINKLSVKGGTLTFLKLFEIDRIKEIVSVQEAIINYPKFSPSDVFGKVRLHRAIIPEDFLLAQDYFILNNKTLPYDLNDEEKSELKEARDIYLSLSKQLMQEGYGKIQRQMEYRMRVIERNISESDIAKYIDLMWNDILRGGYGLYPYRIIILFIFLWLIFSLLYFLFGILKIGWGMELNTNIIAQPIKNEQPQMITYLNYKATFHYLITCIIFSLIQQLTLGLSAFQISSFTKSLTFAPKIYYPIGIGRGIALIQNVTGLILLINFIQAFLRVL